ncbi:MAG: hypothetical protein E6639_25740 [Klebsiella pneumoniae]|uniref:hypothetical protein n=1 Tax=Klebsiella michiganensis TaxID=1134687 RepID=UPI0015AA51CD|nr:hypothetical protein [Klebsiella michiganensis]MDU6133077.1 hypothetical protein [Klebsiella pneumoniae]
MARLLPFLKMDTVLIISSWPTGLYDYVQYMQMQSICIVIAYADGKYMRMPHLCRCPAYGYVEPMLYSLFSRSDPKKGSPGSSILSTLPRAPVTQDVAAQSTAVATRCCVMNLPCDPARRGRKDRFAYSLTVVHFRKVVNRQKIGSPENSRPVI